MNPKGPRAVRLRTAQLRGANVGGSKFDFNSEANQLDAKRMDRVAT
jgi:hypothetical protein